MNTVIVGGGAIGLLLYQQFYTSYAKKHDPQHSLSLKTRNSTFTHFSVSNFQGMSYQVPIKNADQTQLSDADLIFICVKSYQVDAALTQLMPYLKNTVTIILCHNGMGVLSNKTHQHLSEQQTLFTLLTTHGSKKLSSRHIMHTGLGFCDLGVLVGNFSSTKQAQLMACFNHTQLNVHWQTDIIQKQWGKLAINCIINPLTAINNINNGDIRLAKYQPTIQLLIKEFIDVAANNGQYFNFDNLYQLINDVAEKTALNRSSMRSDIINKQPTEIDYINGYIIKLAAKAKIPVPENKKLCQHIHRLTKLY